MADLFRNARYRWPVPLRVLVGIFAGYGLTSLLSIALALLLTSFGANKAEAVLAVSIASFPLYAVVAMAVFHACAPTRGAPGRR